MLIFRYLMDCFIFGRHRLETISMLPLGSSIADAVELYGEALDSEPSEESAEITQYIFRAGPYHDVIVFEWKQKIQSIVYCSAKPDPTRDLACMFDSYKGDSRWKILEEGYWYWREDGKVKLWCSVAPVIGVAYVSFLEAEAEFKKAYSLKQLQELDDVTWAPDDAVCELQREFVENHGTGLMEFADRSEKIAASPDGRYVFIVRNHHAYDVQDGFMELNAPPEPGNGYSTQVINYFQRDENGSAWSKATLPRDANVDSIRFEGEQCHLRISRTTTGLALTFSGPASSILDLSGTCFSHGAYDDEKLWKALEEEAGNMGETNKPPPDDQP